MTRIELKIEKKTITRLAGNEYGERIFNEQVKERLDYEDKNVIVFPSHIDNLAISFVQGFIKNILTKISLDEFNDKFEIEGSEKVKNSFFRSLNY